MKFVLIADENEKPIFFFPFWEVIVFVVVVSLLLIVLFPKNLLKKTLAYKQPSAVSVAYMRSFQGFHPRDKQLLLALIQQEIVMGELENAQRDLPTLRAMEVTQGANVQSQFHWIEYLVLRYKSHHSSNDKANETLLMQRLRVMAKQLSEEPLPEEELKTLAMDDLALGQAAVALSIYKHLMQRNELITAEDFAEGGSIAMQNNAHEDSAIFYKAAYKNSNTVEQKRKYALQVIKVLWAGNLVAPALAFAKQLPDAVIDDYNTLMYLSRLALAADRPDLAEEYLLKALLYENSNKHE